MTVALSLDAAADEVLSWLDPGHAPRIVAVDYIPGAAVEAHRFNDGTLALFDRASGVIHEHILPDGMPPALVRVVAETAPLSAPLLEGMADPPFYPSLVTSGDDRVLFVVLFDAATGERLTAEPIGASEVGEPGEIIAAPTAAILVRATLDPPTATLPRTPPAERATATPVPVPDGPALDAGSVPNALRPVLEAYPLLPGTSWTWETVGLSNNIRWSRSRTRETVTGAWLQGSDQAIVRSRIEQWSLLPPESHADGTHATTTAILWRQVEPDGLVMAYPATWPFATPAPAASAQVGDPGLVVATPDVRWNENFAPHLAGASGTLGLPLESIIAPDAPPTWSWPLRIHTERTTVIVPSGTFHDCGTFEVIASMSSGSIRAICPGVGYAETDTWFGSSWGGLGYTVSRLVSFQVVRPR